MNWWEDFYDENLSNMLLRSKDESEERATCNFLEKILNLKRGDTVFDQCCGEGRLSLGLAAEGFRVIGVDQCQAYIQTANNNDRSAEIVKYFTGDAFVFTTGVEVDAAFNWWTSFGYSVRDSENIKMIACAFQSLKPGGRYAVDFLNAPNILSDFKASVLTDKNGCELLRESEFNFLSGVFSTHWTYTLADGSIVKHQSHVRMYMPVDLVNMFTKVGFRKIELFGDESGASLTRHSPRCIIVGEK